MNAQIENEKKYNENMDNFYSMIIKINYMDELTKDGWKIIYNKDNKEILNKKKVSIVSVLGDKNSGKSFILHLLTGKDIPNGYTVTTEGLSFIIPSGQENNDNYILIDTAGTESPLLNDDIRISIEKKQQMIRDRQITDYFLQKFLLEQSDIFICVVDNLSLTVQKFINRIIKNDRYKTIFIIHNLKTFIEKKQVENYVENILKKSLTFKLKEDKYFYIGKDKANDLNENQIFYRQELKQKDKSKKKIIIHLITANEESEAGKYYNKTTINYLKNQLTQVIEKKEVNIVENLKQFLVTISEDIFEKKIEYSSLTEDNNCIKVKNENEELKLKDCLIDVLGYNIIPDTKFKPKYRYGYFIDSSTEQRKFFIEIELYGIWKIKQSLDVKEEYFTIKIIGEKKKGVIEKNYEFNNYIPAKEFNLEIQMDNKNGIVNNEPKPEEENGLYTLIFPLRENNIEEEVIEGESDEEKDF